MWYAELSVHAARAVLRFAVLSAQVPTACSAVPAELLMPSNTWVDKESYSWELRQLAQIFVQNFKKLEVGGVLPLLHAHMLAAGRWLPVNHVHTHDHM